MRPPRHPCPANKIALQSAQSPLTWAQTHATGVPTWCTGRLATATSWACCAVMLALVLPAVSRGANTAPSGAVRALSTGSADPLPGALAEDAHAWLARTDAALARRNYRGIFVHEYHGETETLRVIHRVASDGVSERLVSMDGSGREFIRRNGQLSCYLPDQRTVLVLKSAQPSLPLNVPQLDERWTGQYDVRQIAITRISAHRARVIAVTPLDALRYGYRVWIDDATAMPLKTQLRDSRGAVLEQILFTELELPNHIGDADLRPAVDPRGYRWVRQQEATAPQALAAAARAPLPLAWQLGALPAGFRMTASGLQMLSSGPAQHLVFSDGLASVSVFIQPAHISGNVRFTDAATLGTSSAYSTLLSGYRITAVGEVPPQTVRAIVQSIRGTTVNTDSFSAAATPGLSSSAVTTLDVNGAGALLIIGNLGNGNLGAAPGIGFESRTGTPGPYRTDISDLTPRAASAAVPR